MLSVLLALGASCSWGTGDFLGGFKSRTVPLTSVLVVSQVAGLALMAVLAVAHHTAAPGWPALGFAFLAGLSGLVGLAAMYRGMAVGVMSVVAPIAALAPIIPVIFGLLSGERPSELQIGGMVVALAGAVLISVQGSGHSTHVSPRNFWIGVALAAVAAVGFGGLFVTIHLASSADVIWAVLLQRIAAVALLGMFVLVRRSAVHLNRSDLPSLVLIGLLDVGGTTLFGLASSVGLVSLAAVLASLHPVTTVLLARVVVGERLHRLQQAGFFASLAGVALISAG
ncbi:MAG: DMT family transporter [Candidatus Dormibacteria bacterium]